MSNIISFSTGEVIPDDDETIAKIMKEKLLSNLIENIVELGLNTDGIEFQANLLLVSLAIDVLITKSMGMTNTILSSV